MELNKKIKVKILSFENPNKFWFRTVCEMQNLQTEINSYLSESDVKHNYLPTTDELIIVHILDRYTIRRVKKVIDENKIIISALENGHTSWISRCSIIQLTELTIADTAINSIHMGSIDDIFPARQVCL